MAASLGLMRLDATASREMKMSTTHVFGASTPRPSSDKFHARPLASTIGAEILGVDLK